MGKEITEIQNPKERYAKIAKDYTELSSQEQNQTLIVSGTNEARRAISEEVRKNLGLERRQKCGNSGKQGSHSC